MHNRCIKVEIFLCQKSTNEPDFDCNCFPLTLFVLKALIPQILSITYILETFYLQTDPQIVFHTHNTDST